MNLQFKLMNFENKQVFDDQIPNFEEVDFQSVNIRYKKMLLLSSILEFLILASVATGVVFFNPDIELTQKPFLFYPIALIWFIFRLMIINQRYKSKGYAFRQKDVLYKSGIFFREVAVVPYKRIQHCRNTEGFIQRFFSLSTLYIYSAGGNALTIPGLDREDAVQFKQYIIEQTTNE
jgi:uncharacterized protein